MAARSPSEAVQQFLDPLHLVVSCVTRSVLDARGGYYVSDHPHAVTLSGGNPVSLAGGSRLAFRLVHYYRVVEIEQAGSYQVISVGYFYGFNDANSRELLSFQWHPHGRSPVTEPHLHLGAGAGVGRTEVARAHIPTGYVTLAQVIRFAIEDLDVEPGRPDWRAVLDEAESDLRQ